MKFNITINSTHTNINNLSIYQMLMELSEHYAMIGYDPQSILISDAETGELLEVINGDEYQFNYQIKLESLGRSYTIHDLLELIPYINS